jgi:hypothetical protein
MGKSVIYGELRGPWLLKDCKQQQRNEFLKSPSMLCDDEVFDRLGSNWKDVYTLEKATYADAKRPTPAFLSGKRLQSSHAPRSSFLNH